MKKILHILGVFILSGCSHPITQVKVTQVKENTIYSCKWINFKTSNIDKDGTVWYQQSMEGIPYRDKSGYQSYTDKNGLTSEFGYGEPSQDFIKRLNEYNCKEIK